MVQLEADSALMKWIRSGGTQALGVHHPHKRPTAEDVKRKPSGLPAP